MSNTDLRRVVPEAEVDAYEVRPGRLFAVRLPPSAATPQARDVVYRQMAETLKGTGARAVVLPHGSSLEVYDPAPLPCGEPQ